jgi:RNA polymerase sigma-70 factor (ECF subfamily)
VTDGTDSTDSTDPTDSTDGPARAAIDSVFRMESARLIAGLARYTGDVGLAEELAQDALVAALVQWPEAGVPRNAGAWLMTVAKRRAVDLFRRNRQLERKYAEIGRDLQTVGNDPSPDFDDIESDDIDDDLLRLVFTACHPVLSVPARVALTLRLLGGLSTGEIARAYLVPERTVAQRIVRAKKTIAAANVPFEVPSGQDRARRLASVLEVIYLIFNEGYSATAGDDWMRPELCADALRLGRVLAQLTPHEPEVHGFVALMEIQSSRVRARTGPSGEPILLLDQDRTRWDRLLINRGLAALTEAEELGGGRGPYALQAAIAACHARAFHAEDTDWTRIAGLYAVPAQEAPSPVVELNRAVAVSMAFGAQAGLELVDALTAEPAMGSYSLLPSVRGDLLVKLGRPDEARLEFERAATLTQNVQERRLSLERAGGCPARRAGGAEIRSRLTRRGDSDQLRLSRLPTRASPQATTPAARRSSQEKATQVTGMRAPHAVIAVPTMRVANRGLAYQKTRAGTPAFGPKTPSGAIPRKDAMRCEPARRTAMPSVQKKAAGVTRPASDSPAFTTIAVSTHADTGMMRWAQAVSRYGRPSILDVPELSACSRRPSHQAPNPR